MTANASWSVAPVPTVSSNSSSSSSSSRSSQGNASWGLAGSGLAGSAPRPKENIFLKRMGLKGSDGGGGAAGGVGGGLTKASLLQGLGGQGAVVGSNSRFDVDSTLRGTRGEQSPFMPTRQGDGNGNGNKLQPSQMITSSVSTSALSHMTFHNASHDGGGGGGSVKLRDETLRSLGISRPASRLKPGMPLRSALKRHDGTGGMSRALTMASIREVEVCLPNCQTITRNSSINFNEAVKVRKIPSSSSLVQHKNELWFQEDEMKSMRQKARSMANMAEINGATDDAFVRQTGDTLRGLERYFDSRAHGRRRRDKHELWDAVMDEQEDMRYYGKKYDDEKIAELCRSISVDSMRAAQLRAQNDALAVQELTLLRSSGEA